MPTIITRGAISARSAGTFAYVPPAPVPPVPPPPPPPPGPPPPPPPPPVYQTVQFSSNDYWTCPAGVYYVVNLEVYGGVYSTTPDQWIYTAGGNNFVFYSQEGTAQAGSVSAFYTYEQAGNVADAALASINSGGTGDRVAVFDQRRNFYNPNTGGYYDVADFVSLRVRGVATRASGPWDNRSGQPVRGIGNGWYFGVEVFYPGSTANGTPSSALGYSAAGGTSPGQQFVTTASYVPVTPGQQYFIEVGTENGVVVIQYVQP